MGASAKETPEWTDPALYKAVFMSFLQRINAVRFVGQGKKPLSVVSALYSTYLWLLVAIQYREVCYSG